MKIVIDRSRWLRGEGPQKSFLLRPEDGKMCCLGQLLLQLGKTEDDIRNVKSPESILRFDGTSCERPGDGTNLVISYSWDRFVTLPDQVMDAMNVNDNRLTDDAHKERRLKELLLPHGYELEFVDGGV